MRVDAFLRNRSVQPLLRIAGRLYTRIHRSAIRIDEPPNAHVPSAICTLEGWFLSPRDGARPSLHVNSVELPWTPVDRPDVRALFGEKRWQGFRAVLDFGILPALPLTSDQRLTLELVIDGKTVAARSLTVDPEAIGDAGRAAVSHGEKREWLKKHTACPLCPVGTGFLEFGTHEIRCRKCGQTFPDDGGIMNFLPSELRETCHIEEAESISAHGYDEVATGIIEEVRRNGGKVLDCGSGLRARVDETVVCLELERLPSVDVLAVNQRLPFQNAVFDAVFSLNVLEHVTDPFACAAELARVLKPGGKLYCCVPFLQPEHGYPRHYFNATRAGMRQLFPKDLEMVDQFVPRSGEPIWTLQWFLSWYHKQLPPEERSRFLKMRVQDFMEKPTVDLLQEPWVTGLSSEGKWQLASTTAAVFRRRTE